MQPGMADRIVTMMEKEQEHRHDGNRKAWSATRLGQWLAAGYTLVITSAAVYFAGHGADAAATAAMVTLGANVVPAFLGYLKREKDAKALPPAK